MTNMGQEPVGAMSLSTPSWSKSPSEIFHIFIHWTLLLPRGFSRNQYIWAVMTMMGGSCGRKNGQTSIWYRSRQCVVSLVRLRSLLAS